ncbi:hypothetical protein ACFQ08_05400 [Streptosporangium algeriense]|uniref:Uncharacterized protein n=1 Tax=Streptosporangium algeriense TaxID=1682748 RepID=A0ABW3DLX9_9ACTN
MASATPKDHVRVALPSGPPTLTLDAAGELLEILLEAHAQLQSHVLPDAA